MPVWLDHLAALSWRLLAVGALAAVLLLIAGQLATITVTLVVVLVLLATVEPSVARLRARGWTRGKSAAAGWAMAMGAIVVLAAIVLVAVVPYAVDLIRSMSAGLAALDDHLQSLSLSPEASAAVTEVGDKVKDWITASLSEIVSSVSFIATVGILTFFLTFFAMLDADHAVTWILQAASDEQRETLASSGRTAATRVGAFVRGSAVIGTARALATLAILWGLGVPYAGPLAAIVFLGSFVPFLGPLATTAAVVMAALGTGSVPTALATLGLVVLTYVAAEILLSRWARARLTLLDPMAVIVALPVGAAVAGVLGLALAVPVTLALSAISGAVVTAIGSNVEREDDEFMPVWLDRLGQWSWRLLVVILLLALAVRAVLLVPLIVLPLVLAAVFAATLAPLVRALGRRGMGSTSAALVSTAGALIATVAILALTVASLAKQAREIVETALQGASGIDQALADALAALRSGVDEVGVSLTAGLDGVSGEAAALTVAVVLSVLLCFFLLRDGARIWSEIAARLVPWRRERADRAAGQAATVLSGYMIGTGAISAFGAITQFLIMAVLGLPLALPLAVLSFFGGFIPYIGSMITTGLAFLVTVAVGSPTDIVIMLAFTLIFNIVTGNIVAPLVYGKAVNIHPAIVLMAIPAGGAIGGILGMFLVVPIVGIIATTWRTVLSVFDDPPAATGGASKEIDPAPAGGDAAAAEAPAAGAATDLSPDAAPA